MCYGLFKYDFSKDRVGGALALKGFRFPRQGININRNFTDISFDPPKGINR